MITLRGFYFGFILVLLAGCADEPRNVPLVNGSIDWFEDQDEISDQGNQWRVVAEGSGTHADIYFPEGGFTDSSRHFLAVEGVRPREPQGPDVAGVRVSLRELPAAADPDQESLAADITAFQGVAFAMKGTPGTYIVQLGSTLVSDFDYYNSYVEVAEEWQEYRIPFNLFRQEGFGESVDWDGRFASHIAFFPNLGGSFRFAVDDVRFYLD